MKIMKKKLKLIEKRVEEDVLYTDLAWITEDNKVLIPPSQVEYFRGILKELGIKGEYDGNLWFIIR